MCIYVFAVSAALLSPVELVRKGKWLDINFLVFSIFIPLSLTFSLSLSLFLTHQALTLINKNY